MVSLIVSFVDYGSVWGIKVNKNTYKLYYKSNSEERLYEVDCSGDVSVERAVESMKNVLKFNGYV